MMISSRFNIDDFFVFLKNPNLYNLKVLVPMIFNLDKTRIKEVYRFLFSYVDFTQMDQEGVARLCLESKSQTFRNLYIKQIARKIRIKKLSKFNADSYFNLTNDRSSVNTVHFLQEVSNVKDRLLVDIALNYIIYTIKVNLDDRDIQYQILKMMYEMKGSDVLRTRYMVLNNVIFSQCYDSSINELFQLNMKTQQLWEVFQEFSDDGTNPNPNRGYKFTENQFLDYIRSLDSKDLSRYKSSIKRISKNFSKKVVKTVDNIYTVTEIIKA